MSQVVIGTAGHIDHGKTALVKALTGTDTDRLPEEKRRGMTIDLGFAFLTDDITIIDVPGHEKFIRNMVAGVSAIDLALITVAADDGIMPQTREHIDILRLLGVKLGCIVLTKVDLVEDPEWLDLLEDEIRSCVRDSFFENAPILHASSETGEGVESVRSTLLRLAGEAEEKEDRGFFRLFVDRAFSMKGFGTVVTGTVVSGSVEEGDEVGLLPQGKNVKIRGLQTHGSTVHSVHLGDRAAVNLSNVNRSDLKRGSQLVSKNFITSTRAIGAEISLLSQTERAIRHEQRVRVHLGTDEVMGRVYFVHDSQRRKLNPGENGVALVRLEKQTAVAMDDPMILRFYSPPETIGGGVTIDTHPPSQWKKAKSWLKSLEGVHKHQRLEKYLESTAREPITLEGWSQRWQVSAPVIRNLLEDLSITEFGPPDNPFLTLSSVLEHQKKDFLSVVNDFHRSSPYKKGIARDELRNKLGYSGALFDFLADQLGRQEKIKVSAGLIGLGDFRIKLSPEDETVARRVETELRRSRFTPPSVSELGKLHELNGSEVLQILHILRDQGKVEEIQRELWFHSANLETMEKETKRFLETHSSMAVNDFKSLTRTTRKHAIPLLEYLDRRRVTQRDGDRRVLCT